MDGDSAQRRDLSASARARNSPALQADLPKIGELTCNESKIRF